MNSVREAYELFRRDDEVDRADRLSFIKHLESAPPLTPLEHALLKRCLAQDEYDLVNGRLFVKGAHPSKQSIGRQMSNSIDTLNVTNSALKWSRILSGNSQVKKYIRFQQGDNVVWEKAMAIVHASPKEVLAWLWNYCR